MVLYTKPNNKSISLSIYVCAPNELYKAFQSNMKQTVLCRFRMDLSQVGSYYTVFTWTYVHKVGLTRVDEPGFSASVSHGIKNK